MSDLQNLIAKYHQDLIKNEEAYKSLLNRGLTKETVKKELIGFYSKNDSSGAKELLGYETNEDMLVLPNHETKDGKTITSGIRCKLIENGDWRIKNGKQAYLLGTLAIDSSYKGVVLISEDEWDRLIVIQKGFQAITGTGGANVWKDKWNDLLPKDARYVICYDNDESGRKGSMKVATSLVNSGIKSVKVIDLSSVCKEPKEDLSDFFVKYKKKATDLQELIDKTDCFKIVKETKSESNFPDPLAKQAYHGILGDFLRMIDPYTEADPAALAFQFLSAFGNVIDRKRYFLVEGTRHYPLIYLVVVGDSSKARKGTSWGRIKQIFTRLSEDWAKTRVLSGLSSGEGLISQVRDPVVIEVEEKRKKVTRTIDYGITDKRLLLIEEEFGSVLQMNKRDGNTLASVIRQAWDGRYLKTLTKNNPVSCSKPYISIIGHITIKELHELISKSDLYNGYANRFGIALLKQII